MTVSDLERAASSCSAALSTLQSAEPLTGEPEPGDFGSEDVATATRVSYIDARQRVVVFKADAQAFIGNLTEAARAYTRQDQTIASSIGSLGAVLPPAPTTSGPTTAGPLFKPATPKPGGPQALLSPYIRQPGLLNSGKIPGINNPSTTESDNGHHAGRGQ